MAAAASASSDETVVLMCGSVDWDSLTPSRAILSPRILAPLLGRHVVAISTGCSASHVFFISSDGEVYAMGRNKSGQLGLGDMISRSTPQLVGALSKITQAACGRHHSLFLTTEGAVFAVGDNKSGQCGQSTLKTFTTPTAVVLPRHQKAVAIACGVDFSLVLLEGGNVCSFGSPQYGQLGHGTDEQTLEKANKVTFVPQPQAREIVALAGKKIAEIACGNNHSIARSDQGAVFCWGYGGFGRLGLQDQKDQFVPKELQLFSSRPPLKATRIAAGASVSFAVCVSGQTYCWGKYKTTGDAYMYPKPVQDLMGWKVRDISGGNISIFVLADTSVIAWGQGAVGELGFGEQKSSANPKLVDALSKVPLRTVRCAYATTFFIASEGEEVAKFDKYVPDAEGGTEDAEDEPEPEEANASKKRPHGKAPASAKKTKAAA